jgi:secreted trypsin-like serine protease
MQKSSHPNLINGREAEIGEFPEVVWLQIGNSRCTGTLVGPRVLVTAAHCASNGQTIRFQVGQTQYTAKATRSSLYPAQDHDIALGLINGSVEGVPFASVGGQAEVGTAITLAGYGCVRPGGGGGNDGKLRVGESTVVNFSGFDMVSKLENGAALCFGDSGGPAFMRLEDAHNEHHVLIGVNSKGDIRTTNYNTRTDINESQNFFRGFATRHNVSICGVTEDCE